MCLPARLLHVDGARASRNPPVAGCIYTTLLLHFSILYILSVYLFISLSVYISVWLYIYLVSVYLSIHLSIYLVSVCQSLYLFACLHLHQSVMILWIVVCWQCKTDLQDSPVYIWFLTRKLVQWQEFSFQRVQSTKPDTLEQRRRVYKPAMERVISRVKDTIYQYTTIKSIIKYRREMALNYKWEFWDPWEESWRMNGIWVWKRPVWPIILPCILAQVKPHLLPCSDGKPHFLLIGNILYLKPTNKWSYQTRLKWCKKGSRGLMQVWERNNKPVMVRFEVGERVLVFKIIPGSCDKLR